MLTLYRNAESAIKTLDPKILEALNEDERASWTFIAGRDKVTSGELMKELAFDERKAQRVLKKTHGGQTDPTRWARGVQPITKWFAPE